MYLKLVTPDYVATVPTDAPTHKARSNTARRATQTGAEEQVEGHGLSLYIERTALKII